MKIDTSKCENAYEYLELFLNSGVFISLDYLIFKSTKRLPDSVLGDILYCWKRFQLQKDKKDTVSIQNKLYFEEVYKPLKQITI